MEDDYRALMATAGPGKSRLANAHAGSFVTEGSYNFTSRGSRLAR